MDNLSSEVRESTQKLLNQLWVIANDKQKQLFLSLFSNFAKSLPSYGKISSGYFKILESILVDTLKSENKQHSEHIKEIFN